MTFQGPATITTTFTTPTLIGTQIVSDQILPNTSPTLIGTKIVCDQILPNNLPTLLDTKIVCDHEHIYLQLNVNRIQHIIDNISYDIVINTITIFDAF